MQKFERCECKFVTCLCVLRIIETESVIAKVLSIIRSVLNCPADVVLTGLSHVLGGTVLSHVAVETVVELSSQAEAATGTSFALFCPADPSPSFLLSWRNFCKAFRQVAIVVGNPEFFRCHSD